MKPGWTRVDASWLPTGWEKRRDIVVEFYDDGQLRRVARMRGAACIEELTLLRGVARGRQTDHEGSGGTPDWCTHEDGWTESFDAWSDNSRPQRDPFPDFARRSILQVLGK